MKDSEVLDLKDLIFRLISFWKQILIFSIISILLSLIYTRYINYDYYTYAKIEILDKAQDSEMALPTSMTIFNRSMINLENEVGRLSSFNLNQKVVSKLKSNIKFYKAGKLKNTELHSSEIPNFLDISYKINTDNILETSSYILSFENIPAIQIQHLDKNNQLVKTYNFNDKSTRAIEHGLPFELDFDKDYFDRNDELDDIIIYFFPKNESVQLFRKLLNLEQSINIPLRGSFNSGSDQINLSLNYPNKLIAEDYINTLIDEFDKEGIFDRRLEYQATIEFVNERSKIIVEDLEVFEETKENYKSLNKISDININSERSIDQQYNYDSELFDFKSQKDILSLLQEEINELNYSLLPVNFGLKNESLNLLINQYNSLIKERNNLISLGNGENNPLVLNLKNDIVNMFNNISKSVKNYNESLDLTISNIYAKEKEFESFYTNIPENEKVLRSIQRELEIKEAIYLLLLQKREEAAINYAVVKPTIKIIDSASSTDYPVSPSRKLILATGLLLGIIMPVIYYLIRFYFDNKIHIKSDITEKLNIPVVGEIPYVSDLDSLSDRSILSESMRMLFTNLKYKFAAKNQKKSKSILVTSSVKGEGKTLIAFNLVKILNSLNHKTIILGADLRNPQLHKYLGIKKDEFKGISEYLINDLQLEDIIISNNNIDYILSGLIPPNPTELLQSKKFANLINKLKEKYEYIIVDSAPCLLVADTFQFADSIDFTVYSVRAGHTEKKVLNFIKELNDNNKLSNISLVLNSIGHKESSYYGYKYGYKYGYEYGYNYGYGYGYKEDK